MPAQNKPCYGLCSFGLWLQDAGNGSAISRDHFVLTSLSFTLVFRSANHLKQLQQNPANLPGFDANTCDELDADEYDSGPTHIVSSHERQTWTHSVLLDSGRQTVVQCACLFLPLFMSSFSSRFVLVSAFELFLAAGYH